MRCAWLAALMIFVLSVAGCHGGHIRQFRVAKTLSLAASTATLPFDWTVPATWSTVVPESDFVLAAYQLPGEIGLTVSSLGRDGGGLLGNINRWARQLDIQPISDVHQVTRSISTAFDWVVLIGKGEHPAGIRVAVFTTPSATWYFKFTGSEAVLRRSESLYLNAMQSVRFKP